MRIVSLNAWGGKVWPDLGAWCARIGADVLCLQEVTRAPRPGPDWLRYVDAYRSLDQRGDLFADISACLPGHQARFAAAARGPLHDRDGVGHLSEHGLGQWVARDLAICGTWQGFVHGGFRADGWGPEPVPRAMQIARIATATGATMLVAHLHGLRDPSGKGDTPARMAQARAIVAAIAAMRHDGEGVVLAGDLNLLPDSATFDVLATLGLSDLITGRGFDDTRTPLYPKAQRHANYLLVSPEVRVTAFDVPEHPVVSDHRPLILDVSPEI